MFGRQVNGRLPISQIEIRKGPWFKGLHAW